MHRPFQAILRFRGLGRHAPPAEVGAPEHFIWKPSTGGKLLAAQPADLRKSFDSLALLVQEGLQGDPLSGDIFVFRNKAADRIKLLVWEEDGYSIWYKRLEAGTFRFPKSPDAKPRVEIRAADLVMLLEGIDLTSVRRGKRYHRPVPRPPVVNHVGP